ncbi:MAG: glycoside hydrolase family 2 [Eggerthellaceae bacterium]|nr:glycoside hydrolase family 2 [Eggerthellaceae bacterium]
MLHLKKLLAAKPKERIEVHLHSLLTPWGEELDLEHVLEEHPTPQFARSDYQVLNGPWRCAFVDNGHDPSEDMEHVVRSALCPEDQEFSQDIVVPFSPEAPLSGIGYRLQPSELIWYKRDLPVPKLEDDARLLIHFQAVDYACAVYVNGELCGTHAGGYLPFSFDVTDLLRAEGNELVVCVADPSEFGGQPRGKQRFDRGDIWYTAQSGIWQTVWTEVVPAAHLEALSVEADALTGILSVGFQVKLGGTEEGQIILEVIDQGSVVATARCDAETTCALAVHVPDAHVWSPADPHLYTLRVRFGKDEVESYCGFRTVEVREDSAGCARIFLNGDPFFVRGVLDQGYWPDGLLTAPSDEALVFDIQAMQNAGFNLLRKHIKVENARWYYHCDRLGMLVWQDMVSGGDATLNSWDFSYKPSLFKFSWRLMRDTTVRNRERLGAGDESYRREWKKTCAGTVRTLVSHPCIIAWTLFNEGWGQFDSAAALDAVRAIDPTRPVCVASGWYDQGVGDIRGVHNYFRDLAVWKVGLRRRAFVVTEFGGFAHRVAGHSARDDAYGYEVFDTIEEWKLRTSALLSEVDSLEPHGLAGFVLTQVSDIEEEVNGILTYDRKVNKWDGRQ